jgi:hypothetical protein
VLDEVGDFAVDFGGDGDDAAGARVSMVIP